MIVYEVIGWTARIDWADTPREIRLHFFSTHEKAEAHIEKLKEIGRAHV